MSSLALPCLAAAAAVTLLALTARGAAAAARALGGSTASLADLLRRLADLPGPEADLAQALAPLAGSPRALELTVEAGLCPVCGELLTNDAVLCRDCLTPHHRGCFAWNGRCGTYACGGRRTFPGDLGSLVSRARAAGQ